MHLRLQHLIFAALVISLVSLAYGINYMYLSNCELTSFGDRICFATGDTCGGAIQSNSSICISGNPVFLGPVYFTGPIPTWGPGDYPYFAVPPVPYADTVYVSQVAQNLRACATVQGTFYNLPGRSYRVHLRGDTAYVSPYYIGTPFDSTDTRTVSMPRRRCMFFDGPLEIEGHFTGDASIGTSHDMMLLDNVVYDDADSLGNTPSTSLNYLMLTAEGAIKVANTPANGRNDSNARGLNQTNMDSSSIVITAALYALGESFTFEQQNDADSGYVYQDPVGTNHVDDRGTIYLYGSLTQMRRGYTHRSANQSTGYLRHYRWDTRFTNWNPAGGFEFDLPAHHSTDTLDFGSVPVGHTVWDTAHIYVSSPCEMGPVIAPSPFFATRVPPYYASSFHIPVSFTPPHASQYSGILYVSTPERYIQIVLRGHGMPGGAPISFDVSPNPFNLTTTLRYNLAEAGAVKIILYDVLGRTAKEISLSAQEAGDHAVTLNAEGLASGVYFVRLQAAGHFVTKKVMLMK